MKLIFPLLLGAGLVMPVAEAVPTLNVESSCKAAAMINEQSKMADPQSFNACMRDENEARGELAKMWANVPPATRSRCMQEATAAGINSYVDALVCMQIAAAVAKEHQTKLKGASKKKQ